MPVRIGHHFPDFPNPANHSARCIASWRLWFDTWFFESLIKNFIRESFSSVKLVHKVSWFSDSGCWLVVTSFPFLIRSSRRLSPVQFVAEKPCRIHRNTAKMVLPEEYPVYGPFFGVMGAASAIIFSGQYWGRFGRVMFGVLWPERLAVFREKLKVASGRMRQR